MTQRSSQLEQRIRILISPAPRHGAMASLLSTALATSLVCAATTVQTPEMHPAPQVTRMPGPQHKTLSEQVEASIQARYPSLYEQPLAGTALVRVVLNPSGWIDRVHFERLPNVLREDEVDTSAERFRAALGVRVSEVATTGVKLATLGNDLGNNIFIVFALKKEAEDPSGGAAIVQAAVRQRFPELFEATSAILQSHVRVLMNNDGTIARADKVVLMEGGADGSFHRTDQTLRPAFNLPERFLDLGVRLRDIESTGNLSVMVDPVPAKRVGIDYAWLKRGAALSDATSIGNGLRDVGRQP